MRKPALFAAMALALGFPAVPSMAQDPPSVAATQSAIATRGDEVAALLNGKIAPEDIFSASFLAAVPAAQMKALSASLTAQFGAAVAVVQLDPNDGTRASVQIQFERGLAKGEIGIDPAEGNRVNLLLITSVDSLVVADDTAERIAADIAALPGTVNALFAPLDGGDPVIAIRPQQPLALGSAVKLYVLAALAEDVKAGKRRWTDVVALTERSYPSGMLQDWPKGAPLTLHSLASLMIAISDNTATDQLIMVLDQNRLQRVLRDSGHSNPAANDPFLTTRMLFLLKASDPATIDAWRSGEAASMAAVEAAIAFDRPSLDQINAAFANGPKALDIEWFAAPDDLARLLVHMRRTADPAAFDIMAINPSATASIKARWSYIGYKGGSEPGVLNYTWLLRDKAGRDHILTLGWNNPDAVLDEGKLNAIAQRILLLPH